MRVSYLNLTGKMVPIKKRKAQAGIEYMIIVAFVTFAIMSVLVLSIFYSNQMKDRVRLNQIENFAVQLTSSAEAVFFAGEPSKTTIRLYLPDGIEDIEIVSEGIIITAQVYAGQNKRLFESKVPLSGSLVVNEGVRKITLTATDSSVVLS